MGKRPHRKMINAELKKPFGNEIRGLKGNRLEANSCPLRGRPQKVDKEKKFAYLLYIPVELHKSLIEYINSSAQRNVSMRSVILDGLVDELEDLKEGRVKNDYQLVEKSNRGECKYLLNIPINTNRILDQILKVLGQDAITKRSILLVGLQNKLHALNKVRLQ